MAAPTMRMSSSRDSAGLPGLKRKIDAAQLILAPLESSAPDFWKQHSGSHPTDILFIHVPTAIDIRGYHGDGAMEGVGAMRKFASQIPGVGAELAKRGGGKMKRVLGLAMGILSTGGGLHPLSKKIVLAPEHEEGFVRASRQASLGGAFRGMTVGEVMGLMKTWLHDPSVLDRRPLDGVYRTPAAQARDHFADDASAAGGRKSRRR